MENYINLSLFLQIFDPNKKKEIKKEHRIVQKIMSSNGELSTIHIGDTVNC
jgi:hypothetical protein